MLLLTYPELKVHPGPVTDALITARATPEVLSVWEELVQQDIQPIDEDEDF